MADDPFRLRVLKALGACIKTVTPANGYRNDLSDFTDSAGRPALRVFRGRTVFGQNDPLPAVALLEDPHPREPTEGANPNVAAMNSFRVLIQGFVQDDKLHPLDPAYILSAEIISAIVKLKRDHFNLLGLGGRAPCVTGISIGEPVHRPPDDDISTVAFFLIPVTLNLAENLETPFA